MSKRPSSGALPPAKKVAPIFLKGAAKAAATANKGRFEAGPSSLIHFHHLDPLASTEPPPKDPVALVLYDLDGTLIRTKSGNTFPKDSEDWKWWDNSVKSHLREVAKDGRHIIVLSNQLMPAVGKKQKNWKAKVELISESIDDVPIRVLAAMDRDKFRKPNTGMYDFVVKLYEEKGWKIDHERSLYVGDAAGRKGDHSNTDFTMALNAGLHFETPETHFLGKQPNHPDPPAAFRPTTVEGYGTLPPVVPSNTPIARDETEIVLFIGPPASGKTSFYRRHFSNYEHLNQDTLKTRDACVKAARLAALQGRPMVVDNQNRDAATRAVWVKLAKELKLPIRAFHFTLPVELAEHNNLYRALHGPPSEPKRNVVPKIAFGQFRSSYDVPQVKEGFEEIRAVNFVWQGREEQFKLWDRYLLTK